jgi:hypothetical protein
MGQPGLGGLMGFQTDERRDNWHMVHIKGGLRGAAYAVYMSKTYPRRYTHPEFANAHKWCLSDAIRYHFRPTSEGRFYFENDKDAMVFKLVWA